jgi:oxygen-dependent protoporphyrinogen oxidase
MRVCVVGGGISGLSAAYRLQQAGADVTLLEGQERVGGLLGTERFAGFVVETGADSILTEKPWAMQLAEELGLQEHIIKTSHRERGAYIVHDGKLERVPEGFSLMAPTDLVPMALSPIVSKRGKLRMLGDLVLPRGGSADESLESFVVRRLGRETFERLAQPMVGGIYGADPKKLSLAATMPRFIELEAKHRSIIRGLITRKKSAAEKSAGNASGARYGMFAAFDGGMQTLIDALANKLGERIQMRALVTAVERDKHGWSVEVRGTWQPYDALIVALPAHVAGQVVHTLDAELARELFAIEYGSAATVTFIWPRSAIAHPLDAFGFVVPAREKREILASTWASVKYPGRAPAGKALIRVFIGGYTGQHLIERNDAELIAIARRELGQLLGVSAEPEWTLVKRYLKAMPQYHVGHLERVARIEAYERRHPRFALAGNAYRGVGIPDAIKSGADAAQRILNPQAH